MLSQKTVLNAIRHYTRKGTHGFAGDILRTLACAYRDKHFRADVLEKASLDEMLDFQHKALGSLIAFEYADHHCDVICEIAGAALEEGNYHPEAAVVRAMAWAGADCKEVVG